MSRRSERAEASSEMGTWDEAERVVQPTDRRVWSVFVCLRPEHAKAARRNERASGIRQQDLVGREGPSHERPTLSLGDYRGGRGRHGTRRRRILEGFLGDWSYSGEDSAGVE